MAEPDSTEISPELYFFRFAYPCTDKKLLRREITKQEHDELERRFLESNPPTRETMERVYAPAFVFIKELAEAMGRDYWDLEVLKRYVEVVHNKIIDEGRGEYEKMHPRDKEFCKVGIGRVVEKTKLGKSDAVKVRYEGNNNTYEMPVYSVLFPDIKPGDRVMVHDFYVIEKL